MIYEANIDALSWILTLLLFKSILNFYIFDNDLWCGVGSKNSRAATGKFVFEWNLLHASCYSLFVAAIDLNRSVFSLFCHLAVWVGSKNNGRACQHCDVMC